MKKEMSAVGGMPTKIFDDGNLKVIKNGESIEVSFKYDENMVAEIKKIEGRKFDWERKMWIVPAEKEDEIKKFIDMFGNMKMKIKEFLKKCDGEYREPKYPKTWNWLKKEYAAIIDFDEDSEILRTFLGKRVRFSSSGKNADIEYDESEMPDVLDVGTILEIRDGSHKHLNTAYYRKDDDGWKFLGYREGMSRYFGGYREKMNALVVKK